MVNAFRLVAYPTARGCAAAYYPEVNALVPLDSTARGSNCPTSKSIVIRLEPAIPGRSTRLTPSARTGSGAGADDHHKSAVQPHHLS